MASGWRTTFAIALVVVAVCLEFTIRGRQAGPYAASVSAVVVARQLFIEDSSGQTRIWLGVENQYGDEEGPRFVMYDEKGQARLALRLVREEIEQSIYHEGRHAEVVSPDEADEQRNESKDATIVMFNEQARIDVSLW
jgi:hypothetical protein